MLDGWYCRSLAASEQHSQVENNEQNNVDDTDSSSQENDESHQAANNSVDYKTQYRYLKRKLKFLIYENEFFQDALRSNQRRLLKVSRDRAFLLDRLLQYEKPDNTSSESEETEDSSDDETAKELKRRKSEQGVSSSTTGAPRGRKKKTVASVEASNQQIVNIGENQQTHAEIERQLSKRPVMEMIPERTVPHEMFNNEREPSIDSDPTDHLVECTSPTHVAAEECVPMEYSN